YSGAFTHMIATLSSGPSPAAASTFASRFARSSNSPYVRRRAPQTIAVRSGASSATVRHARANEWSVTPGEASRELHPRNHPGEVEEAGAVAGRVEDVRAVFVAAGLDRVHAVAEADRHMPIGRDVAEVLRLMAEVEEQRARSVQCLVDAHRRAV